MGPQKEQLLAKADIAAVEAAKAADQSAREAWLKIAECYKNPAKRQPYQPVRVQLKCWLRALNKC
jgi:hypothetical protein